MSKVYVVSETGKHNIAPALEYGEIEIVLPPSQSQVIFSSGPTVSRVKRSQERRYIPIQIDLFNRGEGDDD
jgi:hypothetical protein